MAQGQSRLQRGIKRGLFSFGLEDVLLGCLQVGIRLLQCLILLRLLNGQGKMRRQRLNAFYILFIEIADVLMGQN